MVIIRIVWGVIIEVKEENRLLVFFNKLNVLVILLIVFGIVVIIVVIFLNIFIIVLKFLISFVDIIRIGFKVVVNKFIFIISFWVGLGNVLNLLIILDIYLVVFLIIGDNILFIFIVVVLIEFFKVVREFFKLLDIVLVIFFDDLL